MIAMRSAMKTQGNPLPRNGGGLGRGKPVHEWNEPSLTSPTPTLPEFGGGGTARALAKEEN
jgi:hypothetical protein